MNREDFIIRMEEDNPEINEALLTEFADNYLCDNESYEKNKSEFILFELRQKNPKGEYVMCQDCHKIYNMWDEGSSSDSRCDACWVKFQEDKETGRIVQSRGIFIVSEIVSNICEIRNKVFTDYNKALKYFMDDYNHSKKEYYKEFYEDEASDTWEETINDKFKEFSYDDGDYYYNVKLECFRLDELNPKWEVEE